MTKTTLLVPTGKKVLAYDVVTIRSARSGDYPPMIISLPKKIIEAMRLSRGESLRIYTDGEKIYLDRFEEPTI